MPNASKRILQAIIREHADIPSVINTDGWRGDGAGKDVFELGDNLINPIRDMGTGLALMTLHGNPYGTSTDAAILRLGTNTRQLLATLHILDRGVLDFGTGGTKPAPNILYLNQLTLNDINTRLTVCNWIHQADYLLVKKAWGNTTVSPILAQVHFEGYVPARWQSIDIVGYDD